MSTSRSDTADASLIATAGTYLEELAGLLNVQFEGRYLFAGDATGTAPVDLDGYAATADAADTSPGKAAFFDWATKLTLPKAEA